MNKMKQIIALLVIALFVCTMLSACGTDGEKKVIKIGVFEPLTGVNANGGKQEVLGIRYAHSLISTVEINGETYEIELVEVDNQSDPLKSPSAAQFLVDSGVSVVLGTYGSDCAIAAGSTFAENKIPAIGASCTSPLVTEDNDYYFRVCFLDTFQGEVMATFALKNGLKTVGVLTQSGNDYYIGLANYFKETFENAAGTVVQEFYSADQKDFGEVLGRFNECDAVFMPSSIETAPLLIQQFRQINEDCMILSSDTWENVSIIEAAGDSATNVYFSTFYDEGDTENPQRNEFVSGYKAWLNANPQFLTENGGNDTVAAVSALGYDAYMVAVKAIKSAQSTDGSTIRTALKSVKHSGVTSEISFDAKGDANENIAYIKTIDITSGTFVTVDTQKKVTN